MVTKSDLFRDKEYGQTIQNMPASDTIRSNKDCLTRKFPMADKLRLDRRDFLEQVSVGIVRATHEGLILRCDARFAEVVGCSQDEVPGLTFKEITAPEDAAAFMEALRRLWTGAIDAISLETRFIRKDGSLTWVKLTASVQSDLEGHPLYLLTLVEDINVRKAAEENLVATAEALQAREERYLNAFQTCPDAVLIIQLSNGTIIDANRAFLDVMGFESQEVIDRTSMELGMWADATDRQKLADALHQNSGCRDLEVRLRRKNGEVFWGQLSASFAEIEGVPCILAFIRDVSAAKVAEEEIKNLAFYDPLTGLPNRRLLWERLRQALIVSTRTRCKHALLFVDLDDFKALNDTFGHHVGDLMLQEAARRIASCVREVDTVARLGGDEFVVIIEDLSEIPEVAATQAKSVGAKILEAISQPYSLDGSECHSTSSMGITVFGDHGAGTNEVLQQADIAMYQAKSAGRNNMLFFAPALQASVNARAAIEDDLRQAIQQKQFSLYYQPQLERGLLTGVEALIRWKHPKRGIVLPCEFVPMAEETGLILPMGSWVLETACTQIAAWTARKEGAHLTVAVNISAREFRQPKFVEQVLTVLSRTGANPERLKLELAESMLLNNVDDVVAKMKELKSHGVRFSLDGFGTGRSSMTHLKRLPWDQLKIDRSFVGEIMADPISGAVAQAIISFGKAIGLSVIAEGVETEEQRAFLAKLGCHSFQGYLFSHPLPWGDF
jgi:diguanylate cyclase (GGDEF)-like protein/PAS domain S-box-containing protein